MNNRVPIIAVDFDGTLCDHRFPDIGGEVPEAFHWLRHFQSHGCRLILWTMRSDDRPDGSNPLAAAVAWCKARGVDFWAVNANPEQASWTRSPKAHAHIYIDDAALGCPLCDFPRADSRPVVDWSVVGPRVCSMFDIASAIAKESA